MERLDVEVDIKKTKGELQTRQDEMKWRHDRILDASKPDLKLASYYKCMIEIDTVTADILHIIIKINPKNIENMLNYCYRLYGLSTDDVIAVAETYGHHKIANQVREFIPKAGSDEHRVAKLTLSTNGHVARIAGNNQAKALKTIDTKIGDNSIARLTVSSMWTISFCAGYMLYALSKEVYGPNDDVILNELIEMGETLSYHLSKIASHLVLLNILMLYSMWFLLVCNCLLCF